METHHENMAIWNAFLSNFANLGHFFHEKTFEYPKIKFFKSKFGKISQ